MEKNKTVKAKYDPVMNYGFRVHAPNLLREIVDYSLSRNSGILKIPINQFKHLLARVAERAIELDDPMMNIHMLALNLYEVDPMEIPDAMRKQFKRINTQPK